MERPWGRWTRLYQDEQVELRKLEIVEGGYCTLHYHRGQSNTFYVVAGLLRVHLYGMDSPGSPRELRRGVDLGPSYDLKSFYVRPLEVHRFFAMTRVVAYELLVATGDEPLDPSDSVKLGEAGVGGPNP